jgi:molybdenum cofactor guanylyltransferase
MEDMQLARSAVILAGGTGRRMGFGVEKSLLDLCGRPLIRRIADTLLQTSQEVVVVARNPEQVARLRLVIPEARFACDPVKGFGPVAGLAAGFMAVRGDYTAAVGCDLPFLNSKVIEKLFELCQGFDAAVPMEENGVKETMHSVYRTEAARGAFSRSLELGERKIRAPLERLKVRLVSVKDLRSIDPDLLTFYNLNRPEDLEKARCICTSECPVSNKDKTSWSSSLESALEGGVDRIDHYDEEHQFC